MSSTNQSWTFTSDSCGYMLFLNGIPQGGARTQGTATHTSWGSRRNWRNVRKDVKEFAEQATIECTKRNNTL